ncbi:MAG TPA: DUF2277 domain-containing protein [Anaerolineales bacterium]|nr:DUF2277 domain-containing protein [Anaerolineales bacterium]
MPEIIMCRSIHTLYNIDPPVTEQEIHAACLQFVRKISGYRKPSRLNQAAFTTAVGEIEIASAKLLGALATNVPGRERQVKAGSNSGAVLAVKRG